ncbi:hypothetical protein Droror1_Dr00003194 [Drosera rotundifolia]
MSAMALSRHLGFRFGLSPPSANSIRSSRFDLHRESKSESRRIERRDGLLLSSTRYSDMHVLQILPAWLPRIHKLSIPATNRRLMLKRLCAQRDLNLVDGQCRLSCRSDALITLKDILSWLLCANYVSMFRQLAIWVCVSHKLSHCL